MGDLSEMEGKPQVHQSTMCASSRLYQLAFTGGHFITHCNLYRASMVPGSLQISTAEAPSPRVHRSRPVSQLSAPFVASLLLLDDKI